MYLEQLELSNFRNYKKITLKLSPYINIFYGDNAQGKTNLLEAIYFLGLSKSQRTSDNSSLIRSENNTANVKGILNINDETINMFIGFDNEKKVLKINEQLVSKVKDYNSYMNIIYFGPDDLDLIKGNPEVRRKYLNTQISQMSTSYSKLLDEYNRLLKMRNDYLSNSIYNFDDSYFKILTSYLIERSISIYKYRKNYIDKLNKLVPGIFYSITNFFDFSIKYVPNIDIDYNSNTIKQDLMDLYENKLDEEKAVGKTLIGPHRDDFEYYLENNNLKLYGSQGQQRLSVITLKLAEISVFQDIKGSTPIILLDDVFSELDDKKKNSLLKFINKTAQVIITTTELTNIDKKILKNAHIMKICNGNLEEVKEHGTK